MIKNVNQSHLHRNIHMVDQNTFFFSEKQFCLLTSLRCEKFIHVSTQNTRNLLSYIHTENHVLRIHNKFQDLKFYTNYTSNFMTKLT